MKYWSERDGFRPDRLIELWEKLGEEQSWEDGLDAAAEEAFGLDLPGTYLEHAVWNTFACGGDDGRHYQDDVLRCLPTVTVPKQAWDGTPVDLVHEQGPYTAAYLELAEVDLPAI